MNHLKLLKALYAGTVRPTGRVPNPVYLNIGVTTHCNLRCIMCSNPNLEGKKHIERDVFFQAVDKVDPAITVFAGLGEPFTHPDLFLFLDHLRSRGVPTAVTTNGVLLKKNMDRVFDAGLKMVSVSLDATTPEEYFAIRQRDCFDDVAGGLAELADRKRTRGLAYPYINQHVVVQMQNLHKIEDSVRQAAGFGVDMLHFFPALPIFEADKNGSVQVDVPFEEFRDRFSRALRLAESLGLRTNGPYLMRNIENGYKACSGGDLRTDFKPCVDPWLSLFVNEDGLVSPCCKIMCNYSHEKRSVFLGDLKTQELREIVNSEPYRRFLGRLKQGAAEYATCTSCIVYSIRDYAANYLKRNLLKEQ